VNTTGLRLVWLGLALLASPMRPDMAAAVCGDGVVELGEECDEWPANGTEASCCTASCTYAATGQACRSGGACELGQGSCSGSDGTCAPVGPFAAGAVLASTDPRSGHCYARFRRSPTDWNAAQAYCNERGGYLAAIEDEHENVIARRVSTGGDVWIGITDQDAESGNDPFAFALASDGSLLSYHAFGGGEPNGDVNENCVQWIGSSLAWNDLACSNSLPFVCEFEQAPGLADCPAAPVACKTGETGGSLLSLSRPAGEPEKNRLSWKLGRVERTFTSSFSDPTAITGPAFRVCLYDGSGATVARFDIDGSGTCAGKSCWRATGSGSRRGYAYKDRNATTGISSISLKPGIEDGKAKIKVSGVGANIDIPAFATGPEPVVIQLHSLVTGDCWGASFSEPFLTDPGDTEVFKDKND